ncbi:hypothetical protein Scep_015186 [Stephania cephalantha]|uniref:Uncharacterized protein n=1 Tax=Stephania cephalantha TaxID=152367 RepID=A0AAP0P2K0_9MAGN
MLSSSWHSALPLHYGICFQWCILMPTTNILSSLAFHSKITIRKVIKMRHHNTKTITSTSLLKNKKIKK